MEDPGQIAVAPATFRFDRDRFEAVWRLSTYAVTSAMLDVELTCMAVMKLKPLELIVFQLVAAANIQRHLRELQPLSAGTRDTVPGPDTNVGVSRRRIADASGLPRETVRRVLSGLEARGLVRARGDGSVEVPIGLIRGDEHGFDADDLLNPVIRLFDTLARLGVIVADGALPGEAALPR